MTSHRKNILNHKDAQNQVNYSKNCKIQPQTSPDSNHLPQIVWGGPPTRFSYDILIFLLSTNLKRDAFYLFQFSDTSSTSTFDTLYKYWNCFSLTCGSVVETPMQKKEKKHELPCINISYIRVVISLNSNATNFRRT